MNNRLKRYGILFLATILLMLTLSGCACEHEWESATCTEPKTCTKCGETEGVALGHEWEGATCDTACTCAVCGETKGDALGHKWQEATEDSPKMCLNCGIMEPLPQPENGQIFLGKGSPCYSEITIIAGDTDCYTILMNMGFQDVYSFYTRAGETAAVKVPSGVFYLAVARGEDWYGTELMFGDDTDYSMAPDTLDCTRYVYSYDLRD